jgi:hypothetical protein
LEEGVTAGPHPSAAVAKRKGEGALGRRGRCCRAARKGRLAAWKGFAGCGEKERGGGPVGPKEKRGEEERRGVFFLFLNSIQIHFSNFQTSLKQETMHSNHDAQALVILTL